MKTQYMRAIRGGRVTAEARVLRRGRTVAFLETRLLDAEGKLAATATSTWQMVAPPTNG